MPEEVELSYIAEDARGPVSRAYFDNAGTVPKIAVYGGVPDTTVTHELGHLLENTLPGAKTAANAFLDYRLNGQRPLPLAQLFPDLRFGPDEEGADDDFARVWGHGSTRSWYNGKRYADGDTEIISMGLERLYDAPTAFAEQDPEYFRFIVGILRGTLR